MSSFTRTSSRTWVPTLPACWQHGPYRLFIESPDEKDVLQNCEPVSQNVPQILPRPLHQLVQLAHGSIGSTQGAKPLWELTQTPRMRTCMVPRTDLMASDIFDSDADVYSATWWDLMIYKLEQAGGNTLYITYPHHFHPSFSLSNGSTVLSQDSMFQATNSWIKILQQHESPTLRVLKILLRSGFVVFVSTGVKHPEHSVITDLFSSWRVVASRVYLSSRQLCVEPWCSSPTRLPQRMQSPHR